MATGKINIRLCEFSDSRSGWTTSAKLRQSLIRSVASELNATYTQALSNTDDPFPQTDDVESAIKTGFNRLDNEIVHESVRKVEAEKSKAVAAEYLTPALSGSCALLSFYDSNSKLLRVACTGDSRAVLGRKSESGKWSAIPLSTDQTGQNQEEAERLRAEHPGEPYVVTNGRVLGGLEPTRAFGDATYKWTTETLDKLKKNYFYRPPRNMYKTPPYVTAEPIVTTTKIQPDKGDFLVMATDGLWELLSNEEVIGLVGQWLEAHGSEAASNSATTLSAAWLASWFKQNKQLPVEPPKENAPKDGNKSPRRSGQWNPDTIRADRFVLQDKNVATHLVRNALGGRNTDQLCAMLTLPSPLSRRYR
jgi:pyruvate dehydrogenase phosphatase